MAGASHRAFSGGAQEKFLMLGIRGDGNIDGEEMLLCTSECHILLPGFACPRADALSSFHVAVGMQKRR